MHSEIEIVRACTFMWVGCDALSGVYESQKGENDISEVVFQVLDATRAHFHSPATREMYVALPPEDAEEGNC